MNMGDIIISPFITLLAFLFRSLETLPEQIPGLTTALTVTLFALTIRLITLPFFIRQIGSMEKEREFQTRLVELQRRYTDSQKLMQAQVELYRELGINPLSGCFSTLIYLPFFFGIYSAISVAVGASPYKIFSLQGRVLLPNLSDLIPFPVQFLGLNLARSNLWLAVLVTAVLFMERSLLRREQTNRQRIYLVPLLLGILSFTSLASAVGIFLTVFCLTNMALYVSMESAGLRRLFLGREKARRWELQRALKQKVITAKRFSQLLNSLLQPPELNQEDAALAVKFLELGAANIRESWPLALMDNAGRVLARLSGSKSLPHDLGALYHKFSERCLALGYKERAADLAAQGYACPQSKLESKTANVLLLARAGFVDKRAQTIYKSFIAENTPASTPVQKLSRTFQDKGVITPDMDTNAVNQRIPLIACAAELLPGQIYPWAKGSLGLAYLILNELEQAQKYLQETLVLNPVDATAVQGLVVVWFRLKQYDQGLQVLQKARQAGSSDTTIEILEGFCQAVSWLDDVDVADVTLQQLESWYARVQDAFPLRRFLVVEAAYIQGRLAGIIGDWRNAHQHLQAAYTADKKNQKYTYHYVQMLQISGEWEIASKAARNKKSDPPELLCQFLKQARHEAGLHQLKQELLQLASDANSEGLKKRLVSAKYALLTGQSAHIPAWSPQLRFETSEQADEWVTIWLSALIGRGATRDARQEIESRRIIRLLQPEQLFLTAALKWLSKDLAGAERDLRECLKLVPNYENALRLLAAILEGRGDPAQVYPLLERLQKVAPNDRRAAAREALLRWESGEENTAITQLHELIADPVIGPQAKFWLGRFYLIRATKSFDPQDLQQAGLHLQGAVEVGIPDATWYAWLCDAIKDYKPNSGWDRKAAARLTKELPGSLSEIPIVEVAMTAALIAIETNDPVHMLEGCRILFNQLRNHQSTNASSNVSLENWAEALWRTAITVKFLPDKLALSKLAHDVGDAFPDHSRVARQVADVMVMNAVTDLVQSGEGTDVVLAQIESAIEMAPNSLIPRLARASLLIQKHAMTTEDAEAYLRHESQSVIAQALEDYVNLTTNSRASMRPHGLAAFLTVNKARLPNLVSTLQTLSVEAVDRDDCALLLEMARCMATVGNHDEAIELFVQAYQLAPSPVIAKEFSDYLFNFVASSAVTDTASTIADLEKAQQLISMARTYSLEGVQ